MKVKFFTLNKLVIKFIALKEFYLSRIPFNENIAFVYSEILDTMFKIKEYF